MTVSPDSSLYHSQVTRMVPESVIERLKATGQFSAYQLSLVQEELDRYFHNESAIDWNFSELPIGSVVGGYCLESLIGEGGVGHVYRARHSEMQDQCVALKLIRNLRSNDRFRREMELVQRLAHPNVVIAYEVGEHKGVPYIVLEELSGPDLHVHVKQSGPIAWQQSIELMIDAARGLEHAHQRGLIHRDVKPGNLMFDAGRIKVTDLGLAVLSEDEDEMENLDSMFRTGTETSGGTPEFMAPEQAKSLATATVQSDVYGLGATWFYVLTGRARVDGASLNEKISRLINNVSIESLPADCAPDEVRVVLNRMVAHRAEDRYRSMAEVGDALESIRSASDTVGVRHGIEILIVEDDKDDLFLTVEMLKRGNNSVTVHEARSLSQAIETKAIHPSIDLILLDLQLPDSSGIDTVKKARTTMPDVPIVVLTGQEDNVLNQACVKAGADDIACKNDLNVHLLERIIFITLSRSTRKTSSDYPET